MIEHCQVVTDYDNLIGNKIHLSHIILEVGNNGCGPDSVEEFVKDLLDTMKCAKENKESIVVGGYAGLKDILVHPNGTFSIIDISHLKHYKLVNDLGSI